MSIYVQHNTFSFYSLTKVNYTAKICVTVQLLDGKKCQLTNCYMSSFDVHDLSKNYKCFFSFRLNFQGAKKINSTTCEKIIESPLRILVCRNLLGI